MELALMSEEATAREKDEKLRYLKRKWDDQYAVLGRFARLNEMAFEGGGQGEADEEVGSSVSLDLVIVSLLEKLEENQAEFRHLKRELVDEQTILNGLEDLRDLTRPL